MLKYVKRKRIHLDIILYQVESLLLHLHRRLDHSGEVPGRHQAPLQAGQQRQEVRVLHRALRPSCHPPQLLKVLRDGDGDLLPGLHRLWVRLPLQDVRPPNTASALSGGGNK